MAGNRHWAIRRNWAWLVWMLTSAELLRCEISTIGAEPAGMADRVVAAGKLWATVNYFHPYLGYRDIDWDGAWLKAIPKMKSATDAEEYRQGLEMMLAVLGDPCTRVVEKTKREKASMGKVEWKWEEDDLLVIGIPRTRDFPGVMQALRGLATELPRARAVVFDCREASEEALYGFEQSGVARRILGSTAIAPGFRRRFHSGLADGGGGSSGGYHSGFTVIDGQRFEPTEGAKETPAVFVVREKGSLPSIAFALQGVGKARIVSEGPVSDQSVVPTANLEMGEGLKVSVRLAEIFYEDGPGGLQADETVAKSQGVERALKLLRENEPSKKLARERPPSIGHRERSWQDSEPYPPVEARELAVVKIWSVHQYFYPYKELMGEDWEGVLQDALSKVREAQDALAFHLVVAEMVAKVHDSHASASSRELRKHFGVGGPPVSLRWIEGQPVVTRLLDADVAKSVGIEVGDAIVTIGGEEMPGRVEEMSKYVSASTPQALMRRVCSLLLAGPENSTIRVKVRKADGELKEVDLVRKSSYRQQQEGERDGEIFRLLEGNIGYADLDRLSPGMVDEMFETFREARAIIFDMRGYPNGTAWTIAPRLSKKKSPIAAQFRRPIVMYPQGEAGDLEQAATYSFSQRIPPGSGGWVYERPTVMLIDERTISQAEHTGLFFLAANGTKFIGTPSNGANGDVTSIVVPGGIRVSMTGHDVRLADGRQLQRIGLKPDITVAPTIEGLATGRDEVLEEAVKYLKGGEKAE